jgi:hypothetical protein
LSAVVRLSRILRVPHSLALFSLLGLVALGGLESLLDMMVVSGGLGCFVYECIWDGTFVVLWKSGCVSCVADFFFKIMNWLPNTITSALLAG